MTYESSPGASHGRPQEQEGRGGPARGLARCAGRVNGGSRLEEAGLGPSSRRVDIEHTPRGGDGLAPVWTAERAAAFTRARFDGKAPRLCVRTLPPSRGFLPGWPLPSARLVSFDGVIGTMDQSDSRPQLGQRLRHRLAAIPHQRPIWRTRSGLSCSDECFPYVMRPSTSAKRRHLA